LSCFSTQVNAELSTQVIQTINLQGTPGMRDLRAYGDTVAWIMKDPDMAPLNYMKVYYWDGQETHEIGHHYGSTTIAYYSLYDGTIAWIGSSEAYDPNVSLFYWNGTYDATGAPNIETIVSYPRGQTYIYQPALYNGQIAWVQSDGHDNEIFLWDGTYNAGQPNIVQITDNEVNDGKPSFADGVISWSTTVSYNNYPVQYWDGTSIHTLSGTSVLGGTSTSNGAIAWKGTDGNIHYWNGTYVNGSPNIVTAASAGGGVYLGHPSLYNGKVSFFKHDPSRTDGEDEAIFYWNGTDTIQISEWFNIYNGYYPTDEATPATASGGVAYTGTNATTNYQEIRFVTSTGLCL